MVRACLGWESSVARNRVNGIMIAENIDALSHLHVILTAAKNAHLVHIHPRLSSIVHVVKQNLQFLAKHVLIESHPAARLVLKHFLAAVIFVLESVIPVLVRLVRFPSLSLVDAAMTNELSLALFSKLKTRIISSARAFVKRCGIAEDMNAVRNAVL